MIDNIVAHSFQQITFQNQKVFIWQKNRPKTLSIASNETSPKVAYKRLCIVLHGYQASGENLAYALEPLCNSLQDTLILFPNAPFPGIYSGYQWFSLEDRTNLEQVIAPSSQMLADWIKQLQDELGIAEVILIGFSQGGMMALYTAIYKLQVAKVVGLSTKLITHRAETVLKQQGSSMVQSSGQSQQNQSSLSVSPNIPPRVLLIHGEYDTVILSSSFAETKRDLEALSIAYEAHLLPGLEHTIDSRVNQLIIDFLQK